MPYGGKGTSASGKVGVRPKILESERNKALKI